MRTRFVAVVTVVTALSAALAGVAGVGGAAPALAQGASPAAGQAAQAVQAAQTAQAGQVRSAPAGGGAGYSAFAYSQVTVTGNANPGALSAPTTYLPTPCWIEPRFTGAQSYHKGDPQPAANYDADSYWWWFAGQEPALVGVFGRIPGLKQALNAVFKAKQGAAGWWWVPAWVSGNSQGYGCAYALVQMLRWSAQYLKFQGPQPGGDGPGHAINGQVLADLARAELVLPTFKISTNPKAGTPADVNLPVWVWLTYNGRRNPADTATVPTPAGPLSATVTTSQPQVSLSVSAPGQAIVHNQCGATGSRYSGNPSATPPCGVTFLAPSTGGPYTITVTAKWTVTWTASDAPGQHQFASPPWPVPQQTGTSSVTVQEVQSINGPSPGP